MKKIFYLSSNIKMQIKTEIFHLLNKQASALIYSSWEYKLVPFPGKQFLSACQETFKFSYILTK